MTLTLALSAAPASAADGVWSPFPNSGVAHTPTARHGHSMILDAANQRLVVFGGFQSSAGNAVNDAWMAPLGPVPDFSQLSLAVAPAPRYGFGAVYDPVRQRMLVFSGVSFPPAGMDTWALSLGTTPGWSQVVASGAPASHRQGCGAIYDPIRDRVLIFGGYDGSNFHNEVLVFSPGPSPSWSVLATTGTPPSPRDYAAVVYDPVQDRMMVFGGNSGVEYQDTWALDLTTTPATWSHWFPVGAPPAPRLASSAIYDPIGQRMIVFGGVAAPATFYGDTWALSLTGTPTWSPVPVASGPLPRHSAPAVFDPAGSRLLLMGGDGVSGSLDDLWSLSLGGTPVWSRIQSFGPPAEYGLAMAYDPPRRRMLVTGGAPLQSSADLYALSLDTNPGWDRLAPAEPNPGSRQGATLTYDAEHDRMLLFGGFDSGAHYHNDLWQLDLSDTPTWSLLPAFDPPPARDYHSATFDPEGGRLVVFGGNSAGTPLNDLWWLDLTTLQWHQAPEPGRSPTPRLAHGAVLDAARHRILIYGGVGANGEVADVWAVQLGTLKFNPIPLTGGPGPRHSAGVVMDPNRQAMLVHGGWNGVRSQNDLWELTLGPRPSWRLVDVDPPGPARHGQGVAFDDVVDRLVEYGGYAGPQNIIHGDTWQFAFAPNIARVAPAGLDRLEPRATFALAGFSPNPGPPRPVVSFSIVRPGSAHLEVLEVSGRRVRSLDLPGLEAGVHHVPLGGAALAPGLYLLRLTYAGKSLTTRGVILR